MRDLRGKLPTDIDMHQTRREIMSLMARATSLAPQVRRTFNEQMRQAESQLTMIRVKLTDPGLKIASRSEELTKAIARQWSILSTTLVRAAAYCA